MLRQKMKNAALVTVRIFLSLYSLTEQEPQRRRIHYTCSKLKRVNGNMFFQCRNICIVETESVLHALLVDLELRKLRTDLHQYSAHNVLTCPCGTVVYTFRGKLVANATHGIHRGLSQKFVSSVD